MSTVPAHDVVAAALVREGKVLLCHRTSTRVWCPDVWDLPGGHVVSGETGVEALVREMREELGIALTSVGRVWKRSSSPIERLRVWHVTTWDGEPKNLALDEHDEIGWFTPKQAAGLSLALPDYLTWFNRM